MDFYCDAIYDHLAYFVRSPSKIIHIIAPFIRLDPLRKILDGVSKDTRIVVITNWKTQNILQGFSDIKVYSYIKEKDGLCYANQRLHAKCLIADMQTSIVMTANVTNKGLGLSPDANLECAVKIDSPPITFFSWVNTLLTRSVLVNDSLYEHVRQFYDANRHCRRIEKADLDLNALQSGSCRNLSALPYSPSPDVLIERLLKMCRVEGLADLTPEEILEAIHDAQILGIDGNRTTDCGRSTIKDAFFLIPYVDEFMKFVEKGKYFGDSKRWLQKTCSDAPAPTLKQLTRYIRVLFDWVNDLGSGCYRIIRPHHSEKLIRLADSGPSLESAGLYLCPGLDGGHAPLLS